MHGRCRVALIAELFQHSPFEPLLHHLKIVRQCVTLVRPMFEAVRDENDGELDELVKRVFKTEHEADTIKDEIRQVIPRTFFLPVYRGDLLGYLKLQDDMADSVEDIAILLTIKKLRMPPSLVTQVFSYVETVLRACDKNHEMNERLPDLVARGFVAEQATGLMDLIRTVEKAEWEADKAQYSLSKALFAMEDELKPSDLMLWWRAFLELGQLANHAEKMAERLRRMLSQ
ncbi:MAG: TIGR00153 family protein [Planctomycetota bacterium]|nr:MAG: TIGR00153 family protein [Planctomycetota bacterium]